MRRALVLLGGTMKGAYLAGVLSAFGENLPSDFFNSIYSRSVGVGQGVFYVAEQTDVMQKLWRDKVTGRQLINFFNIFSRKPIIDLDYLVNLIKANLNYEKVIKSNTNQFCFATEVDSRMPVMFDLKKNDMFEVMKATCALPFIYRKVRIGDSYYMDGAWAKSEKWNDEMNKIYEKYDEILVIINKNSDMKYIPYSPKLKIIKTSHMPLWYPFDTNQSRISATIDQGRADAIEFLKNEGWYQDTKHIRNHIYDPA